MNEFEVLIELGAEGGSLALHGIRTEHGWVFSRQLVDWTPELVDEKRIQGKSTCVDSWDAQAEANMCERCVEPATMGAMFERRTVLKLAATATAGLAFLPHALAQNAKAA